MLPITNPVLVSAPATPTTGRAIRSLAFSLFRAIHNQPDTTPIMIRQPRAIHTALAAPARESAKKGEKAKDSSVGAVVAVHMEHRPNTPPKTAPARGPSSTAPTMTGMWSVVARMRGRGISPMPVSWRTSCSATNRATPTSQRVSCLRVFIFTLPPAAAPPSADAAHKFKRARTAPVLSAVYYTRYQPKMQGKTSWLYSERIRRYNSCNVPKGGTNDVKRKNCPAGGHRGHCRL